jgi:hypothetical protein
VSYEAKRGRKASIDRFITSTRTSAAVSRMAVNQLVVPAVAAAAAACLHRQRAPAMSRRTMTYSLMGRQRAFLDAKLISVLQTVGTVAVVAGPSLAR